MLATFLTEDVHPLITEVETHCLETAAGAPRPLEHAVGCTRTNGHAAIARSAPEGNVETRNLRLDEKPGDQRGRDTGACPLPDLCPPLTKLGLQASALHQAPRTLLFRSGALDGGGHVAIEAREVLRHALEVPRRAPSERLERASEERRSRVSNPRPESGDRSAALVLVEGRRVDGIGPRETEGGDSRAVRQPNRHPFERAPDLFAV